MPKNKKYICKVKKYKEHKEQKRSQQRKVLKMLAVMEASSSNSHSTPNSTPSSEQSVEQFLSTGRTGRRNALPDILSDHSLITSSDLPLQLESLSTDDKKVIDPNQPSTSKQPDLGDGNYR